jgi:hypothetical protein
VSPLQAQLDAVLSGLQDSGARLERCQGELAQLDGRVAELKGAFQLSVREAEGLRLAVGKAEATLGAATGAWAGERAEGLLSGGIPTSSLSDLT